MEYRTGRKKPETEHNVRRDPVPQSLLDAIVDRIEVDDRELRILARKDILQQAVIANAAGRNEVRSFVPRWLGD
jgi:hypothetical protein